MSTIVGCPKFKITRCGPWIITVLTLAHVESTKVQVRQEGLRAGRSAFRITCCVLCFGDVFNDTIKDELLGDVAWFYYDILH
jgi:hypothetical protein